MIYSHFYPAAQNSVPWNFGAEIGPKRPFNQKREFDYIVIGAGTAGCVIANRLSAGPNMRVLLLEAGPKDTNRWIHVPAGMGRVFANTDVNWA